MFGLSMRKPIYGSNRSIRGCRNHLYIRLNIIWSRLSVHTSKESGSKVNTLRYGIPLCMYYIKKVKLETFIRKLNACITCVRCIEISYSNDILASFNWIMSSYIFIPISVSEGFLFTYQSLKVFYLHISLWRF